ncbi:hypothetical protein, partial [Rubinisphaera sp.]|uniref:hypothetical protein n=1 Tax=Rubinisphaera sp. TaxID=2024857 RepID=UPI0025E6AED1
MAPLSEFTKSTRGNSFGVGLQEVCIRLRRPERIFRGHPRVPDRLVQVVIIEHLKGGRGIETFYSTVVEHKP